MAGKTTSKTEQTLTKLGFRGLAIIVLAACVAFLSMRLSHAKSLQTQLEEQQKTMTEQLDRQASIIDGLRAKQSEAEQLIKDSVPVVTSEQLEEQLNSIRELVTQQYIYTNADRSESHQTWFFGWARPFSGKSLLVTYDGTIKAGIDLSNVQVEVNEDKHTITVSLPDSKITDNNIPQESISVLEVKDGLFNKVSFDDYNTFISEQKIVMEKKAISQGILTAADDEARAVVSAFLSLVPGIDNYTLTID